MTDDGRRNLPDVPAFGVSGAAGKVPDIRGESEEKEGEEMRIEEAIELLEGVIYERNAIISYNSELPEIYIKEKVALEEAVKVLKRYNRLVQVKARPVKQRIKIQYEGEENHEQVQNFGRPVHRSVREKAIPHTGVKGFC